MVVAVPFIISWSLDLFLCCRIACETALKQKYLFEESETEGFFDSASQLEQLNSLDRVFETAAEADTAKEVRNWLSSFSSLLFDKCLPCIWS